jgi:hypothetical protein
MPPTITAIYAAVLTLLVLVLAARIVVYRNQHRIGIGDGDDKLLRRMIRVHGNAVEYVPLLLILMLTAELIGVTANWLHPIGITFVVGRVLHAYGLSGAGGYSFGRFTGTLVSWIAMLVLIALVGLRAFGVHP